MAPLGPAGVAYGDDGDYVAGGEPAGGGEPAAQGCGCAPDGRGAPLGATGLLVLATVLLRRRERKTSR